ncbi:hypothetical protein [Rossellomorea marisflavi]|uniref:hypothetical protein n=1 Tax=Rossellomorea marisflavi TaxID=189381 RepID=UPI003F9F0E6D
MADKMMRMAGRGDDNTAKPIKTNNNGAVKVDKQGFVHKVRGTVVQPNTRIGLYGLDETSPYNTAQVSVSQSAVNACKLYAQHGDEANTDYGTTENFDRSLKVVTMRASKRSSKMSIYFWNLGSDPITINADIILSTELSKDNNLMHTQNGEFRQRGDILSGASYSRLFVDDTRPVSSANPLPVTQGSILADELGKIGSKITLGAEKDQNGQGVLRVVNANPHGYSSQKDSIQVVDRCDTWSITKSGTSNVELIRLQEVARYHVAKKIVVSSDDPNTVLSWDLYDGVTKVLSGFAHGSDILPLDSKISNGSALKLAVSTSSSAMLRIGIVGETVEV